MLGLAWALKRKEASPSSGLSLKCPYAIKGLAEVSGVEQTPKMCRGLRGPSISLVINRLIRKYAHQGWSLSALRPSSCQSAAPLCPSWFLRLYLHLYPPRRNCRKGDSCVCWGQGGESIGDPSSFRNIILKTQRKSLP